MDCFVASAPRNDEERPQLRVLATRFARVLNMRRPRSSRGRRECRMQAAPMTRLQQKKQAAVTTGKAGQSGIPCATVLTAASCSPWSAGLDSLHRARISPTRKQTPASGDRDHTTSPSAQGAARRRHSRVHRIPPHVRDDAYAPLIGAGQRDTIMISGKKKYIYFREEGLNKRKRLRERANLDFCQRHLPGWHKDANVRLPRPLGVSIGPLPLRSHP